MSALDTPFIAADVGGTYARIGLVRRGGRAVDVLAYRKYLCADFQSLSAILQEFLAQEVHVPVDRYALAVAGIVVDQAVINYNLPWKVSLPQLRGDLKMRDLSLINDFEAMAYAARFIDPALALHLAGPESGAGPLIVVGPGTGLGSAVCIPGRKHAVVLPTEAGQTSLAPGTAREIEVLSWLSRDGAHVSHERILSGPGLCTLYDVLCQMRGYAADLKTPEAITAAVLSGANPVARETLDIFCALLGSFVGNLAMLYGARGGVYLTGGILPAMSEFLKSSRFIDRFLHKGGMRPFLERVPVKLIEHGQLGVIGAAGWYLDSLDEE